jgi:hypothetical protein
MKMKCPAVTAQDPSAARQVLHVLFDAVDPAPDRPEIEHHQQQEERVRADDERPAGSCSPIGTFPTGSNVF